MASGRGPRRAGKRLNSRRRGGEPGRGEPSSRAFNSWRAKAQAPGREARRRAARTPHGPAGFRPRAPPGSGGGPGASSPAPRRSSSASASPVPAFSSPPRPRELRRRRLRQLPGRGRVLPRLSPGMVSSPGFLSLLLHFSAPHAAATSCHRLSNQHGGAGGGSGEIGRAHV